MFKHTLLSDFDFLLSSYLPHVFILAGLGKMIRDLKTILPYQWFAQEGSSGFAILVHQKLDYVVEDRLENFLLLQIEILRKKLSIGGIYTPPNRLLSLEALEQHKNNEIVLRGDFNAKHPQWNHEKSNPSGNKLYERLNENGLTALHTSSATSKKSKSAIDFGIGRRTINWQVARLPEGTSDHYSVLFPSPFSVVENRISRKTNWKMFTFFLRVTHP